MKEAESKKRLLKVPRGTSNYQATWIFDAEEVDRESEDDDDDDDDDENDEEVWITSNWLEIIFLNKLALILL